METFCDKCEQKTSGYWLSCKKVTNPGLVHNVHGSLKTLSVQPSAQLHLNPSFLF